MRDASATTSLARDIMSRNRSRPLFLWVHYFDPHTPYDPPEPYRSLVEPEMPRTGISIPKRIAAENDAMLSPALKLWLRDVRDLRLPPLWYQGETMHLSHNLGRLMRAVARYRPPAATRLVMTADHGESLGEHGIYFGHEGLFQPEVAIPLLIHLPGVAPGLRRGPWVHADLFSLLQGSQGDLPPDDPSRTVVLVHARLESLSVIRGRYKLIVPVNPLFKKNQQRYAFDMLRDPMEVFPDAALPEDLDQEARRLLSGAKPYSASPIPPAEAKKLRALGYLP